MRSFLFALVTLVCACASSPRTQPEAAPTATAPDSTATAAATAQPAPAQGSTGPASAEAAAPSGAGARPEKVAPDSPGGQDAARIADLSKKAAPLVDAFINLEPQLTRDGQRAIFISNRDGLPQVYLADARRPDAPAKRLFEWKERVSQVSTTPDGRSLLFLSDTGADENWSI